MYFMAMCKLIVVKYLGMVLQVDINGFIRFVNTYICIEWIFCCVFNGFRCVYMIY